MVSFQCIAVGSIKPTLFIPSVSPRHPLGSTNKGKHKQIIFMDPPWEDFPPWDNLTWPAACSGNVRNGLMAGVTYHTDLLRRYPLKVLNSYRYLSSCS